MLDRSNHLFTDQVEPGVDIEFAEEAKPSRTRLTQAKVDRPANRKANKLARKQRKRNKG